MIFYEKKIIYSSLCAGSIALAWVCSSYFTPNKIDYVAFERSFNKGSQLLLEGKDDEAIEIFGQLIRLDDSYPTIFFNLGRAYSHQKKWLEALENYERAAALKPNFSPMLHYNMAIAYDALGNQAEAKKILSFAINEQPSYHEAHYFLGTLYEHEKEYQKAYACYSKAVKFDNKYGKALHTLAAHLRDAHEFNDAIDCLDRACEVDEKNFYTYLMLGDCHNMAGHHAKAELMYKKAAELNPESHEAWNNLGALYGAVYADYKKAHAYLAKALKINPDHAGSHCALASSYLAEGDYEKGWEEYEWRLKPYFQNNPRSFIKPRWDGKLSLKNKTVLLTAEQGLGDTFHFIRYAVELKKQGAKTIIEVQKPLVKLLHLCPYIDIIITEGDAIPDYDYYAEIMSLPYLCKTSLKKVPATIPYLHPDQELASSWQQKLAGEKKFKIGICWQVEKTHDADTYRGANKTVAVSFSKRSIPLQLFAALALIEGVALYSLQKGFSDFAAHLPAGVTIRDFGADFDTAHGPFMDTAAIMKSLDLVITADTSIAHLAGGLGVPVWVLLPFPAEWRWLLERPDSPWYPTMRLFRKKSDQDWQGLMHEVTLALNKKIHDTLK